MEPQQLSCESSALTTRPRLSPKWFMFFFTFFQAIILLKINSWLKSTDEKLMICSIHSLKNPPNLAKLVFTPLQAEQGGKHFTPFVLSLQYAKKNKKKYFPIWMEVSSEMSVCCLLSVVCLWWVCLQLSFEALVWLGYFFLPKLEKICFENFNPEVQGSTP